MDFFLSYCAKTQTNTHTDTHRILNLTGELGKSVGIVSIVAISEDASSKPLHVRTPLIESYAMSQQAGFTVYLKLENTQPTATFKLRGIGYMIQKVVTLYDINASLFERL